MPRVVLYIAASLDGYIARKDGAVDWLPEEPEPDGDDHGYAALLESSEALVMGRDTYETVLGFGIPWPYAGIQTYVATRRKDYPTATPLTATTAGDVADFVRELKGRCRKDIWLVGGAEIIRRLLDEDLVDRIDLTLIPILLGEGIPLFLPGKKESRWRTLGAKTYPSGMVGLSYERIDTGG